MSCPLHVSVTLSLARTPTQACGAATEAVVGMMLAVEADGLLGDLAKDIPRLVAKLSWASRNSTAREAFPLWSAHRWPAGWSDVVRTRGCLFDFVRFFVSGKGVHSPA